MTLVFSVVSMLLKAFESHFPFIRINGHASILHLFRGFSLRLWCSKAKCSQLVLCMCRDLGSIKKKRKLDQWYVITCTDI